MILGNTLWTHSMIGKIQTTPQSAHDALLYRGGVGLLESLQEELEQFQDRRR